MVVTEVVTACGCSTNAATEAWSDRVQITGRTNHTGSDNLRAVSEDFIITV